MYGCESWTIKKAEVKVAQLSGTLCDLMDCSPPDSSVEFSRQEYTEELYKKDPQTQIITMV